MKRHYILLFCFLASYTSMSFAQSAPTEFIENKGQWGDWVKYRAKTIAGEMFLENDIFDKVCNFSHCQLKKTIHFFNKLRMNH